MDTNKKRVVILANEVDDDHHPWVNACKDYSSVVDYRVVNLTLYDWFEKVHDEPFDFLLTKPGGRTSNFQQMYSERVSILSDVMGYNLFPSANEIKIYENKRLLSYWLKANRIACPDTKVFYYLKEAENFANQCHFPIVAKTNVGASGSGVAFLNSSRELIEYVRQSFTKAGVRRRSGPNLGKGDLFTRGLNYITNPRAISKRAGIYARIKSDPQSGFVICQEYVDHEFEWRVVRIGESFFAHKKIKVGEKASGTLIKKYENPPMQLLGFVKELTDRSSFFSQAVDIFDTERGYLVNEVQCIFGQSDPYQMLVDGKPGRYRYLNGNWVFEEGDWARDQCYPLRLEYLLNL